MEAELKKAKKEIDQELREKVKVLEQKEEQLRGEGSQIQK